MSTTHSAEPRYSATYRQVWSHRQFRVLFGSRSAATLAETLRVVALSMVVYASAHSAALAALTYGISFLPQLFGAGLFGALPDRVGPRNLLAGGYLAEAVVGAAVALLPLPVWAYLVLLGGAACITPVCTSASSRVVAEILDGDAYVLGRSLSTLASSLAQLLGLVGAGFAVATLGGRHAVLCSAGLYLVGCVWVLTRMAGRPVPPLPSGAGRSTIRASLHGNLTLLRNQPIRTLMLAQWLPPALLTGVDALIVPYAGGRGLAPGTAGWLMAGAPVGMIAGNLVVGRIVAPARREQLVPALVAMMGLPCAVFAFAPPWPLITAALVCVGFGYSYALGVQHRFRDLVPPEHRGQAFRLLSTGLMTAQGLFPAVAGLMAQTVHTVNAILLLGTWALLAALWLRKALPAPASVVAGEA